MIVIINNEQTKNKELYFEESFWTGKRTIRYNDVELKKIKRGIYEYTEGEVTEQFRIQGNQAVGETITLFGNKIELARKVKDYEILLSVLIFLPCLLFGAIGGAIGGALAFTNLMVIRQISAIPTKIIISIEFLAVGLLISYALAVIAFKLIVI